MKKANTPRGLYRPDFEHDACGIGVNRKHKRNKSHKVVVDALDILVNLEHRRGRRGKKHGRRGRDALQLPHRFFVIEAQNMPA